MVVCAADYQLIVGKLYKLGLDQVFHIRVLDDNRQDVLWECH